MTRDFRDTIIETLADSEAVLRAQVQDMAVRLASTEREREGFRLFGVQCAFRLCDMRKELDTLTERYHQTFDDARSLRTEILERAAA